MGAMFLGAALIFSTAWYAVHWHSSQLSRGGMLLRIALWSFLATGAGKVFGILLFRTNSHGKAARS
jgi:hypothetical protein